MITRALITTLLCLATAAEAGAQRPGITLSAGVAASLAELAPREPGAGLTLEAVPDLRFRSGFSIGLGFRYTVYSGVPDRETILVDLRYTRPGPGWRPVLGLRGAAFHGGDEGGDDAYIGVELGPVVGLERQVGPRLAVQALGSVAGVLALYRGARVLPSAQLGLVLR
ncbi:MAG: hypothetical protein AB7R55_18325 [Gemmatimonadales bacterium]